MFHKDSGLNRRADVNKTFNREMKVVFNRTVVWT